MLKKLPLLIFFGLLFVRPAFSQDTLQSQHLLYYVASDEKGQFMVPFIETTLRDLVYASNRDIHLYDTVSSLNIIMESLMLQQTVVDFYTFMNAGKSMKSDPQQEKRDKQIADQLQRNKKFMKISIKQFGDLLEYEFLLYNILATPNTTPQLVYYSGSSVFVDPRSQTYKSEILFAVRQACYESNVRPEVCIRVNGPLSGSDYYFAIGDTIKLEAVVKDIDSPVERIRYYWFFIPDDSLPNVQVLNNGDEKQQLVVSTGTEHCRMAVNVSDGISMSYTSVVSIYIVQKPGLTLYSSHYNPEVLQFRFHSYVFPRFNTPADPQWLTMYYTATNYTGISFEYKITSNQNKTEQLRTETTTPSNIKAMQPRTVSDPDMLIAREDSSGKLFLNGESAVVGFLPEKRKRGNYTLHVVVNDHGIKSEESTFRMQYVNVLPFAAGAGLQTSWLGQKGVKGKRHFVSSLNYNLRLHMLPTFDVGYEYHFIIPNGGDTLYEPTYMRWQSSHTGFLEYFAPTSEDGFAFMARFQAGAYHFPPGSKRAIGLEFFGGFYKDLGVLPLQFFAKAGYSVLIPDMLINAYRGYTMAFGFSYQPSSYRHFH